MGTDQHSRYRQVAIYARLEEAEVARGVLESDGIPAALLDAQMAGLGLGPTVGGVRLLVPAPDEARAVELLTLPAAFAGEPPSSTPTPLPGSVYAPTPAPFPRYEPLPVAQAPGPLALRAAVVVLALALAAIGLLAAAELR
jgi:hypothetical protein